LDENHWFIFQGPVSFRNRQRRAETRISQFQIYSKQQRIQTIAEYSHMLGLNTKCSTCRTLTWPGINNIISIEKKNKSFIQVQFLLILNEVKFDDL